MGNKNSELYSLLVSILAFLLSEKTSLTEHQILDIKSLFVGSTSGATLDTPKKSVQNEQAELIHGLSGLAAFCGVSIPTAQKIHSSGRFGAAEVHFGGRKLCWDKAKLLELAKETQW